MENNIEPTELLKKLTAFMQENKYNDPMINLLFGTFLCKSATDNIIASCDKVLEKKYICEKQVDSDVMLDLYELRKLVNKIHMRTAFKLHFLQQMAEKANFSPETILNKLVDSIKKEAQNV